MVKNSKKPEGTNTSTAPKKATKPLSQKGKALSSVLEDLTVAELSGAYRCLAGTEPLFKQKLLFRNQVALLLDFADQNEFDLFFTGLPLYLQEAIQRGTFEEFVDIRSLQTPTEEPLIVKETRRYYYRESAETNPALRMGIFKAFGQSEMGLYPVFAKVFLQWLPKPPGYTLQPLAEISGTLWTDTQQVTEVIPLLVEATAQLVKTKDRADISRKGLLKGEIKSLRAACALEPFPVASSYGLDPIELFVQALTHLEAKALKRPDDAESYIKMLVQRLFFDPKLVSRESNGIELEYFCLLRQFSRIGYTYSVEIRNHGRNGLKALLQRMYDEGKWFSVENLYQSFALHGYDFTFRNSEVLNRILFMRGESIETEFGPYVPNPYDKGFRATGVLKRVLFEKPLFKAYCYLLAVLGLVEIGEKPAPLVLGKNGKMHPLTPYEGISSMRITTFGAWCLDFTDERPEAKVQEFETIVDSKLLLVTFKGLSLERKLFLELIGYPMGTERYKISEVSFIKGCADPSEIHARIERFKKLIEPEPSERWLSFFSMIEQRATLFAHGETVLLYTFPDDSSIRKMFAIDPAFRKIIIRAEGNRIVIKRKDQGLFKKLLAEHGYLNTL